jgi:hypothetical protein
MTEKDWARVGDVVLIKRYRDEKATRYEISAVMRTREWLAGHVLTDGVRGVAPTKFEWSAMEGIENPGPPLEHGKD